MLCDISLYRLMHQAWTLLFELIDSHWESHHVLLFLEAYDPAVRAIVYSALSVP